MEPKLKPTRLVRRLSKILFATLGGIAILLAVALGVFRLLVAQIPEYQTEIKEWVAAELGLAVDFDTLDARLGLTGPELTLREATIGSGREFLQAEQATITLDSLALIFARRVDVSRLTLDGIRMTVERDLEGTFRLGDFSLANDTPDVAQSIPESVVVAIRDSELLYVDAIRARSWRFSDVEMSIESEGGNTVATASLEAADGLAERVELQFTASSPPGGAGSVNWRLQAESDELDLVALATLLPLETVWPVSGHGAASVAFEWSGNRLAGLNLEIDFENLRVGDSAPYDSIRLNADWQGGGSDWQLGIDDVSVSRNGRSWEASSSAEFSLTSDAGEIQTVSLSGDFFRLEDLSPIVSSFPETQLAEQWALFEPTGDVRDLEFSIERRNSGLVYQLDSSFDRIAVRGVGTTPEVNGMSGRVRATEDSGTIEFQSDAISVQWPALFRESLAAESLTGAVLWRQGLDAVQILSVDLQVGLDGQQARASFDLRLPRNGSAPTVDLEAELAEIDLLAAKRFLPVGIMPPAVVGWLDRAVIGGRGHDIELTLAGNLEAFPFDNGSGQFRVGARLDDTSLNYMRDWPIGEAITGQIEFINQGFFASAAGETEGNRTQNLRVAIPDLRRPILALDLDTTGTLTDVVAFLRSAPLIAERLGPGFERVDVSSGSGSISASLDLPLRDLSAFELDAALTIVDGSLTVRGLRPGISEINGTVIAEEDRVSATAMRGIFLGGAIDATLAPSEASGYRAELSVDGETSADALADAFGLPETGLLDGQTLWRGRLMLPALDPLATSPTRILVESNLAGVAFRLPEPLAKAPGEPVNLAINLQFAAGNRLEVNGNLGATRRFALGFAIDEDRLQFARGAFQFGGSEPRLPVQAGLLVGGQIETLELDQWLALGSESGIGQAVPLFLGADISVSSLHVLGQQLGTTALRVERGRDDWQIDIDSEAIAGEITVPRGSADRRPIVADMSRVYLAPAGESGLGSSDPRVLPGIRIEADEFGFGNRELGRVSAVVESVPEGLVLTAFQSQTPNLQMEITGSWMSQARGTRTTLEAGIQSTDVQAALAELGLDPVIEGESATVTANVYWDAAPTSAWLDHLYGDVNLFVDTGTLREVDPGAGRVVGLMSIAALPRRLLLDFRDVFEEGFAFDDISGTFRIIDGNAYTNDLKFGGPAAEIGVVGRTGLRDRDYRQQIVITAEPSNMLPTVGAVLGGAGVGAALLIFTRLFKEPLRGIGRASYCLTGDWEAPTVESIEDDESEEALRCAELPDEMRPASSDE